MPITSSVGEGGVNQQGNVLFVQLLLGDWQLRNGLPPIVIDGAVGAEMVSALKAFQTQTSEVPDGRVEPGGATILKLEELHMQGLRKNEVTSFPLLLPRSGAPLSLPPGDPNLLFRKYLDTLRKGLG